ncbi:MAG: hypothetical protein M0R28_17755 [Pigmentiphaga sp.]|nr:hypothetical protein [Pigmentiphaga sp.]
MRSTVLSVLALCLAMVLTGCAGVLGFLDAHGRSIADAVLNCVPAFANPSPSQAAACFDSSVQAVGSAINAEPAEKGATVIECAHALREVEQLEREGKPADQARARARQLVDQLSPE